MDARNLNAPGSKFLHDRGDFTLESANFAHHLSPIAGPHEGRERVNAFGREPHPLERYPRLGRKKSTTYRSPVQEPDRPSAASIFAVSSFVAERANGATQMTNREIRMNRRNMAYPSHWSSNRTQSVYAEVADGGSRRDKRSQGPSHSHGLPLVRNDVRSSATDRLT